MNKRKRLFLRAITLVILLLLAVQVSVSYAGISPKQRRIEKISATLEQPDQVERMESPANTPTVNLKIEAIRSIQATRMAADLTPNPYPFPELTAIPYPYPVP